MGHCSCGAHSCATEKKVDAKVSVFHEYGKVIFSLLLLAGGIIMNALDLAFFREGYVSLIWYIVAYLPVGIPVMKEAWESIREKDYFSEFTLMIIATLGAFYIGEYPEGVAVMLFYTVGELFQDKAVDKAKRNIGALLDVRPEKALVLREGNLVTESPKKIKVGEIIEIKAGERVPLDGTMQNEVAAFNTAALTGESVPRNIRKGEEVLAGMIVTDKVIRLEVTRPFDKSALARILELVQNASERKAPAELFIRKFARIYTPIVIALAVLIVLCPFVYSLINPPFVFAFNDWLYRALVFLVISCPCALVVSIPLGYFGGIGAASRLGILFKGGNYLDAITKINTVVFDKTGTLTKGTFDVQVCKSAGDISEEEYRLAETGEFDISVSMLQKIARRYGVALDALMFGEEPKMSSYFLTRAGKGTSIERTKAYKYQSLAAGFMNRNADPFIVTVEPKPNDEPIHYNSHSGQEFNLVLEGRMMLSIDGKDLILNEGDSLYFNSKLPHGMKALDGKKVRFLAVIM